MNIFIYNSILIILIIFFVFLFLNLIKEKEKKEDKYDIQLKQMLDENYTNFVKKLRDAIKDPNFIGAIKKLKDKNKIYTFDIISVVKDLQPTQNEIDIKKSLYYPLFDEKISDIYLKGGIISPNRKIVTGGDGKFIIDGHHMWCQIYIINPYTKIKTLDINIKDPVRALKETQLIIVSDIGNIPMSKINGINLLKIDEKTLKDYVITNIKNKVIEVFKKYNKGNNREEIANYIWKNVEKLQYSNQPIENASERNIMPQTNNSSIF
jgi:hypothetical protein